MVYNSSKERREPMSIKEPMHPGKILKVIMDDNYKSWKLVYPDTSFLCMCYERTSISELILELFFDGRIDVDYLMAYKLGHFSSGMGMGFWLKLQKDYDDYVESSIEKDVYESISQLNDDKVVDRESSNKKESIKSAIFSAKSFLNNALMELE